jgi:enoyl-CoA hydratase
MRYSTRSAEFQIKEIDLGLTTDVGILQRLPHLISQGIVRELAYTGRKFSGEEP